MGGAGALTALVLCGVGVGVGLGVGVQRHLTTKHTHE